MLERLWKFVAGAILGATGPPVFPGPITEGKTRGNMKKPNIKVPPQRPKSGPPAPKPDRFPPDYAIKCDWIEVYIAEPNGPHDGCRIERHDDVEFWVDTNGHLVIFKGLLDNQVVYHKYVKYVTHNAEHWG